jgi:K+-dependent Na+/Ca+ exchanger-like protein
MTGKEPMSETADVYDQHSGDIKKSSDTVKGEDTTTNTNVAAPLELRLTCAMALAMAALVFVSCGAAIRGLMLNKSNKLQDDGNKPLTRMLHSHNETGGNHPNGTLAGKFCHSNIIADPGQFHEPLTVVFYLFGVFYLLIFINVVCEDYFVETVNKAVEVLEIPESAAGATIMAAGSSMPELMAGLVGYTFKEAEDAGVGTVIGSLIFNSLFIIGASVWVSPSQRIGIDPFSLLRDSIFYILSVVSVLIAFTSGEASWITALCLFLLYVLYVVVNMKWSAIEFQLRIKFPALGDAAPESVKAKSAQKQLSDFDNSDGIILDDDIMEEGSNNSSRRQNKSDSPSGNGERSIKDDISDSKSVHIKMDGNSNTHSIRAVPNTCILCMGILIRPIKGLLYYTVPRFLKPGTLQTSRGNWWVFAQMGVSLLWLSVAVFFMIEWAEKAGCLIGISSSLMGLTVLAIGTSTPDAMVSIIATHT